MGNFKVSFTTALFVFSFIICVIVAVVFVDRSPRKDDYDSFYDKDKPASASSTDDTWNRRPEAATPAPTAATAVDPTLAELPIDQSLINNTVPIPSYTPAAAVPTVNPVKGRTPEEIARMIRAQNSGLPQSAAPVIPTVSVPAGIATPQVPTAVQAASPTPYVAQPLRVQSNAPADGAPGNLATHGLSPGFSNSNVAGNTWPTMPNVTPTPSSMQGFRAMPSNNSGMMIGPEKTETDATPPPGFTGSVTQEAPATPFSSGSGSASPGGFGGQPPSLSTGGPASSATPVTGQLLYAPGSPPGSRSALPPAPTLPPPPIVDPDRPRSDAGDAVEDLLTPGSENPQGSSDQALAISGEAPASAPAEESAPQEEKIAALVNDIELTQAQAEKLATANALFTQKPLSQDNRKKQVDEVIDQWTAITAAAEQAREDELPLTEEQFDEYAAMRPDMDVEAWKKSLKEAGFSALEVKQRVAEVAYSEKLVEHITSEKHPDAELKKLFNKNPNQYTSPREVRVLEIFKAKPGNEEDIKKVSSQMTRLQQQAAQGTDFGLLANQASEAASKHKGGERGWETPTEMKDADLAKVLKNLEPGKVSSVIETDEGYRIVKVTEEKPARDDFEGCREKVLEKLKNDLRNTALADAKKSQNVVLSPTGRMITASKARKEKQTASASSRKNTSNKKTDTRTAPESDSKSRDLAVTAAAVASAQSTPSTQSFTSNNKEFVAANPETQQLAGGQPQPAQQAGGQTPAPTQNMGYTPGATIMVGGNGQSSTLNPAGTTTVNHPAQAMVQSNSDTAEASSEDLRREAQAMAAQAKAQEQSRTQSAEWQYKQAQAAAYAQEHGMHLPSTVGPDGGTAQTQGETGVSMTATVRRPGEPPMAAAPNLPVAPQNPDFAQGALTPPPGSLPPLQATPATTQSNGWNVSKQVTSEQDLERQRHAAAAQRGRNQQAQASAAETDMNVPGFGNSPINGAANSQGQQSGESEQKRGITSRVKSFFSRL